MAEPIKWRYLIHDGILVRMGDAPGGFPIQREYKGQWEDFSEYYVEVIHDQRPISAEEARQRMAQEAKFD